MPNEHILFPAEAWGAITLMAGDEHDPDDDAATLAAAMRRHPVGCSCENLGCQRMLALMN